MKRYPLYKQEHRLPGIEEVPEHWGVVRNSLIFREMVETGYGDLELLSILSDKGIVKQSETGRKERAPEDRSNYKRIQKGDIGYNLMNAFMGSIGVSNYEGIISPAYAVCRPKIKIDPNYFHYLFRTDLYLTEFDRNAYGIMYERNRLYFDNFKKIYVPFPSPEEQKAIAHFLDHKLEQIEQYIRNKQRLIELLNEQKTAIINRAVTKGINPNVPMKHSGIEWLGEIPAHWEVKKLKYVKNSEPNSFVDGPFGSNLKSIHYIKDGAVYVVESGFITSGKFILKDFKTISREHFETIKRSSCKGGDIIISKIGANFGMSGILPELNREAVISGNSLKLTINLRLYDTKYIHYHLLSLKNRGTFDLIVNATAQPALSLGTMNNIAVVIPPLYEQQSIVSFIEQELAKIDLVIAQIEKEIELIQEYRTTLISDAVTGKIDVRGFDNSSNSRNSPKPPELATM
jgi:type I restriction enzyme S subunit